MTTTNRMTKFNFLCVERWETEEMGNIHMWENNPGVVYFDVPSIDMVKDQGIEVIGVYGPERGFLGQEGNTMDFLVVVTDSVSGRKVNVRVTSWENVHPSDWSPELIQLSESFV